MAVTARKTRNYTTANGFLGLALYGNSVGGVAATADIADQLTQLNLSTAILSWDRARALRQAAKLAHIIDPGLANNSNFSFPDSTAGGKVS